MDQPPRRFGHPPRAPRPVHPLPPERPPRLDCATATGIEQWIALRVRVSEERSTSQDVVGAYSPSTLRLEESGDVRAASAPAPAPASILGWPTGRSLRRSTRRLSESGGNAGQTRTSGLRPEGRALSLSSTSIRDTAGMTALRSSNHPTDRCRQRSPCGPEGADVTSTSVPPLERISGIARTSDLASISGAKVALSSHRRASTRAAIGTSGSPDSLTRRLPRCRPGSLRSSTVAPQSPWLRQRRLSPASSGKADAMQRSRALQARCAGLGFRNRRSGPRSWR